MAKKRSTATRRAESEAAAARAAAIRAEQDRAERRRRTLVVSVVVVVVVAVVLGIGYAVQSSRDSSGTGGSTPAHALGTYAVPAGPADATTKIVVYEDFMCPFCGEFEKATRSAVQTGIDSGKVQVRYHVLNFLDRSSTTKYSTRAANALAVVLDTSGPQVAKKFHDLLYENQPEEGSAGLSDAQLIDYAVRAGASRSAVGPGIRGQKYKDWVASVTDQSSKAGVTATPTVLINGKKAQGQSTDELAAEVESAIGS
jgi:protein-disulfide isomerase